ncbi:MAG: hypothetical protein HXS48_25865 [Theionarchaea archaeon]|nr:hypothetical protein [Theionarchaea archaeon]
MRETQQITPHCHFGNKKTIIYLLIEARDGNLQNLDEIIGEAAKHIPSENKKHQIFLGKRWLECVTTDPPLFWGKPQSWETIKKRLPEVNPLKKDVLVEMYGSLSQVKFRWLTPVTN